MLIQQQQQQQKVFGIVYHGNGLSVVLHGWGIPEKPLPHIGGWIPLPHIGGWISRPVF